jgi:RNA polymerase sigma-70 factor (ECF subfamily)
MEGMAMSTLLDHWLARAAGGDRAVLPDLLGHCRADMAAHLRRRPYGNEAEDIVQEALLQVCRRLDGFTWQGWAAFRAWVWTFVEHAHADRCAYHARGCRDERRLVEDVPPVRADSSQVGVLAGVAGREETPSRQAHRRERDERLRQAMRDVLTDEQRLAMELRHFGDLPVEEVARLTGWTESKVKMLCKRGRDRLREVLTDSMRPSGAS